MPYSRDEIVAELTAFYDFLVSMYLPDDAIKYPPLEGWPEIHQDQLAFLGRNEDVIDLLKHLPYLRADSEGDPMLIYKGCACNDYSDEHFVKDRSFFIDPPNDPPNEETLDLVQPHKVTLARAHPFTAGFYIFCDTNTGSLELVDFVNGTHREADAKKFFEMLKADFRTLTMVPVNTMEIFAAEGSLKQKKDRLRDVYLKHGWLSMWFHKKECAAEVQDTFDSIF